MRAKPLLCPACGGTMSKVLESREEPRLVKDQLLWTGTGFWRRRECLGCHRTFTTDETVSALDPIPPSAHILPR